MLIHAARKTLSNIHNKKSFNFAPKELIWFEVLHQIERMAHYYLSGQIPTVYQLNSNTANQICDFIGTDIRDECSSDSCENNGTCVDGIGGYTCSCPPGYTGSSCESGGFEQSVDNVCWNSLNIIWNISTTHITGVMFNIHISIVHNLLFSTYTFNILHDYLNNLIQI